MNGIVSGTELGLFFVLVTVAVLFAGFAAINYLMHPEDRDKHHPAH